jgi:meiotically up-regulated gene 157 (Mug157) protein
LSFDFAATARQRIFEQTRFSMHRKTFLRTVGLAAAGAALPRFSFAAASFPVVRTPLAERRFSSAAVEECIRAVERGTTNRELAWLFNNCFPNTLDTTVDFSMVNGRPDTYVITGDIDAMWLRDSTAQVWPYLSLTKKDEALRQLIAGVINRQTKNILLDPYANAFFKDPSRESEWKGDLTEMKPGVHERKWEIDSLCYPIRLAHGYWRTTGDTSVFDAAWKEAAGQILKTFREQQRKEGKGPYKFERRTSWATDGVPLGGYGYPVKPNGLICSLFRPSDDATIYPYLIPSNYFAVVSLKQLAAIAGTVYRDNALAGESLALAREVETALARHARTTHPQFGAVLAYEVNGFGSFNLMDDANVPSLLSLPYLQAISKSDPLYRATRRLVLSTSNPFYFEGKAAAGIGGPHVGVDMIWPLSITIRGLTAADDAEVRSCIRTLAATHGGTGFMHESFHKDDATKFTRKWFAWANTLFGELVWETFQRNRSLLNA